jgi:hypothetical protein
MRNKKEQKTKSQPKNNKKTVSAAAKTEKRNKEVKFATAEEQRDLPSNRLFGKLLRPSTRLS